MILGGILIVSSMLMTGCSKEVEKPEEKKISVLKTPCDYAEAMLSHIKEMQKIIDNDNFSNLERKEQRKIFMGLSQVERERLFLLKRSLKNMGNYKKRYNDFAEDEIKECKYYKDLKLIGERLKPLERFID